MCRALLIIIHIPTILTPKAEDTLRAERAEVVRLKEQNGLLAKELEGAKDASAKEHEP
jgi:hypothetical protein